MYLRSVLSGMTKTKGSFFVYLFKCHNGRCSWRTPGSVLRCWKSNPGQPQVNPGQPQASALNSVPLPPLFAEGGLRVHFSQSFLSTLGVTICEGNQSDQRCIITGDPKSILLHGIQPQPTGLSLALSCRLGVSLGEKCLLFENQRGISLVSQSSGVPTL